jgi:hypothetical protein
MDRFRSTSEVLMSGMKSLSDRSTNRAQLTWCTEAVDRQDRRACNIPLYHSKTCKHNYCNPAQPQSTKTSTRQQPKMSVTKSSDEYTHAATPFASTTTITPASTAATATNTSTPSETNSKNAHTSYPVGPYNVAYCNCGVDCRNFSIVCIHKAQCRRGCTCKCPLAQ